MKNSIKKDSASFEDEFKKLKIIVSEIESTDHDIEKMIELFEEGMKIADSCEKKIESYKKKINLILSENKRKSD